MSIVKDDVTKPVGNLQLCGGQDAGREAAVHSMHDIFGTNNTEAILLVDAENAFNSINRQVFLHNIKHVDLKFGYFPKLGKTILIVLFNLNSSQKLQNI